MQQTYVFYNSIKPAFEHTRSVHGTEAQQVPPAHVLHDHVEVLAVLERVVHLYYPRRVRLGHDMPVTEFRDRGQTVTGQRKHRDGIVDSFETPHTHEVKDSNDKPDWMADNTLVSANNPVNTPRETACAKIYDQKIACTCKLRPTSTTQLPR